MAVWVYAAWKNPRVAEIVILVAGAMFSGIGALRPIARYFLVGGICLGFRALCLGAIVAGRRMAA